jgi:cysteine desulfurase
MGGSHENERRAGTENVPAIIGFAEAVARFVHEPVFPASRLQELSAILLQGVENTPGATFCGSLIARLPNTVSFHVNGCDSMALMAALDLEGICASSGSACSAGSLNPSHVLLAMGVPPAEANSLVRLSLGRESTEAEARFVAGRLPALIDHVRNS